MAGFVRAPDLDEVARPGVFELLHAASDAEALDRQGALRLLGILGDAVPLFLKTPKLVDFLAHKQPALGGRLHDDAKREAAAIGSFFLSRQQRLALEFDFARRPRSAFPDVAPAVLVG